MKEDHPYNYECLCDECEKKLDTRITKCMIFLVIIVSLVVIYG